VFAERLETLGIAGMKKILNRACAIALSASLVWLSTPAFAVDTAARHAIMLDFETGAVLLDKESDVSMPPASMSKLMTIYLLFEQLADGGVKLDDTFHVSEKAWRMGGSKMFVLVNSEVKVEDLVRGIVVQSGNDACVVVAEALGGTEEGFAEMMTEKAEELGMTGSRFANATGWPHPEHRMTARDLATLTNRMIHDFPQYYGYFKETKFTYNKITQSNRNPLLFKDIGADGLKTGHTEEAGYGLVSSAERKGRRLVLVTAGLNSLKERAGENARLMNWGFREFENYSLFQEGEAVSDAKVWLGDTDVVPLIVPESVRMTIRRKARKNLKVKVVYEGPIPAPISAGQKVAEIHISAPEMETRIVPLLAAEDIGRLGFFGRLSASFQYLLWGTTGG
jgi:serine-type D-Ala-D-Ala carboxypeptidase (penicillin-binding protein 5/6)